MEDALASGDEAPAGRDNLAPRKFEAGDCQTRAGTGEVQEAVGGG
jgi:hypothetical protein